MGLTKRDRIELAISFVGTFRKKQLAKALGFHRNCFYTKHTQDSKDKELSNKIAALYETDDTLGHKSLSRLLKVNKKRVLRVMKKYQIKPRAKKGKYRKPGRAKNVCANLLRRKEVEKYEVIFSDIFEFRLKDRSKVYCCFILRKITREILSFCYAYAMRAELVVESIVQAQVTKLERVEIIYHSDQGRQFGADITVEELMRRGFIQSMSRAGTPTDNPYAERFVGTFKLAVVKRYEYETIGQFVIVAENWLNFYNQRRPHSSLGGVSPKQFAEENDLKSVPYLVVKNA